MTSEHQDADLRRLADDAHLQTLSALSALEHLNGLVVSGVIDTRAEVDMDAFATYVMGIRAQLNDVATALDTIHHATLAKKPEQPKEPERPKEDGRKPLPFDLDLLDRATESQHELWLVSNYACLRASELSCVGDVGTMDAISYITDRAARMLRELSDLMSEANANR